MSTRARLARRLSEVEDFEAPQADLEQYRTPPEVAAHLVHRADLEGDLRDAIVVDLGTGTGMLAIGAALRGAATVVGIDVDRSALERAQKNKRRVDAPPAITWIQADATAPGLCPSGAPTSELCQDPPTTVVMNPPFGAQRGNEHADRAFLDTAVDLAAVSYSIHNAGSQSFVESFASDSGGTVTHAFAAEFDIPKQFEFHEADSRTIEVELFRIEWA